MAKNPAVNFYTSDFLTGTTFFSNRAVGAYIRLLCFQHQLGHLSESKIKNILNGLNKDEKSDVMSKFIKDDDGLFFNKRMELEINKKTSYSESRAANRRSKKSNIFVKDMKMICSNFGNYLKKICINYNYKNKNICQNYLLHMENENEIININNINNKYKLYKKLEFNKNIKKDNMLEVLEREFCRPLSSSEIEFIIEQEKILDKRILILAIKECVYHNAKNISYLKSILTNWHGKSYDEIVDLNTKYSSNKNISEDALRIADYDWLQNEWFKK